MMEQEVFKQQEDQLKTRFQTGLDDARAQIANLKADYELGLI
jgi:hypothetical protein